MLAIQDRAVTVRTRLSHIAGSVGVFAVIGSILPYLAGYVWFLDWFAHFRWFYFLILGASGIFMLALRKIPAATLFGAFAVANFVYLAPYLLSSSDPGDGKINSIRITSINVESYNDQYRTLLNYVLSADPDVVVLIEVTPAWQKQISELEKSHPYVIGRTRNDNFGIYMYSRYEYSQADVITLTDSDVPSLLVTIGDGNAAITLLGVHLNWPLRQDTMRDRNAQLEAIGELARSIESPFVVIGDMNTTPFSASFRQLIAESGLRDSALGCGVCGTWPAFIPFFRLPIDHCLVSPKVAVAVFELSPFLGSDHLGLRLDLRY